MSDPSIRACERESGEEGMWVTGQGLSRLTGGLPSLPLDAIPPSLLCLVPSTSASNACLYYYEYSTVLPPPSNQSMLQMHIEAIINQTD